jgi:two-component system, chemotaxis family, sensor histidine kinase and response regulator WspE
MQIVCLTHSITVFSSDHIPNFYMSDYSLLDLFRQEVQAQVGLLKQHLTMLKQQPKSEHDREAVLHALQTIKGISQMVEVEATVALAQTMQAKLSNDLSNDLHPDSLERLSHAGDLLVQISQLEELERERWLADHAYELADLQRENPQVAVPSPTIRVEYNSTETVEPETIEPETIEPPVQEAVRSPVSPLVDASMMDLFRLEVEEQAKILNDGLLVLEAQPTATQPLEALMRAAHSIKGAARIVGLDAAVNLAHSMEDCFVAAQNRTLQLNSNFIDVLFRGVDELQSLSQASDRDLPSWLTQHNAAIESIQSNIHSLRNPGIVQSIAVLPEASRQDHWVVPAIETPSSSPSSNHATATINGATSHTAATIQDRVVRVSADNLNRIMGLAGESLIEANSLPAFADSLMQVRRHQIQLAESLEALEERALNNSALSQSDKALFETVRRQEQECRNLLSDRVTEFESFIRRTTSLSDRLYHEVITSHMRPFEEGVQSFSRMVRDLARSLNKQAKLEIIGKSTSVDRDILTKLEAPLTQILRNAIDHGIESPEARIAAGKPAEGIIRLEAAHRGGMLAITVSDDGRGIDTQRLRQRAIERHLITPELATNLTETELMEFLFLPGFSLSKQVTELSGRGVGLDIVKSMAQEVGGTVRVASHPRKGTSFCFQLPLTLSVVRTLLVEISGESYAFPLSRIDQIVTVPQADISIVENRQYFTFAQKNIGLIAAHQVLDLTPPTSIPDAVWVVIFSDQSNTYGLIVDRCLGERELVVRPLDPRLGNVQDINAAALMSDGSLVLILDVSDLVRSLNTLLSNKRLAKVGETCSQKGEDAKRLLVVDDSITVREMERKLLQNRGYVVDVAVDGMEGWNAIRSYPYDLVITDIDMPRMNGVELIREMKRHPRFQSIPVIVVSYRDREDDRIQGLDAGADYYLTKNSFHDDTLVRAVTDLIG